MKVRLYSIFDRVSGTYGEPFSALKDELAIRRFDYLMANSPMVASDCDLYFLGSFDTNFGTIDNVNYASLPGFVKRYEVKQYE